MKTCLSDGITRQLRAHYERIDPNVAIDPETGEVLWSVYEDELPEGWR